MRRIALGYDGRDAIVIPFSRYIDRLDIYQGYWWDHTELTIAVQAHPNAREAQVGGIHDGIAMWSEVLLDCFDGLITLTDVTGTGNNAHQAADIVVHCVPHFGGVALAGLALCGRQDCNNVLVGSEFPPSLGEEGYTPEYVAWVTLHEVGHALGLGHATNLEQSTDLMGYGWPDLGDPVVSDCDLDAIAFVFAWAIQGGDPHPPGGGSIRLFTGLTHGDHDHDVSSVVWFSCAGGPHPVDRRRHRRLRR